LGERSIKHPKHHHLFQLHPYQRIIFPIIYLQIPHFGHLYKIDDNNQQIKAKTKQRTPQIRPTLIITNQTRERFGLYPTMGRNPTLHHLPRKTLILDNWNPDIVSTSNQRQLQIMQNM
jgi:hypothetical protein